MTAILFDFEDVARGQLDATLSAAGLTIVLNAGEGAEFPQPLNGACDSLGSSTLLNDNAGTGSLQVGDFVRNVTDGSWAYVLTTGANSVTTTRLQGGSDNTWQNADVWRHGEFVVTLIKTADGTATGTVTQRERVLISGRSTDQLTVPTGGRGYDGTVAQEFAVDDFVNLYVTALAFEMFREVIYDIRKLQNTQQSEISALQLDTPMWAGTVAGTDTLTASVTPAPTAYTAGQRFMFLVANNNTGSVTLNINSLGAKTIKRLDGATNLVAGDIKAGQLVMVVYDGTNLQMMSPIGTASSPTVTRLHTSNADSTNLQTETSDTVFSTANVQIDANTSVAGDVITVEVWGQFDGGVNNRQLILTLYWGATSLIAMDALQPTTAGTKRAFYACFQVNIRTIGATGTAQVGGEVRVNHGSTTAELFSRKVNDSTVTIDTTTNKNLGVFFRYNVNDGTKHSYLKQSIYTRHRA